MPLVFLPEHEAPFWWGSTPLPASLWGLVRGGEAWSARVATPDGVEEVRGLKLPLLSTVTTLAVLPTTVLATLPGSVSSWALASKLALELVAREQVVPSMLETPSGTEARWVAALGTSADAARLSTLAAAMAPSAHAIPVGNAKATQVWAPEALLRAFLDTVVDAWVRSAQAPEQPTPSVRPPSRAVTARATARLATTRATAASSPWPERWRAALTGSTPSFTPNGFGERSVVEALQRWTAPVQGASHQLRACFRLELPPDEASPFALSFLLQSPDDPSLLVEASEVWSVKGRRLEKLGRAFRDPQESLLEALGRAGRLFPPLTRALEARSPARLELDANGAGEFLTDGAAVLAGAGFGVIVPGELTATGQRRVRLRMRVGKPARTAGTVDGASGLALSELLAVDWDAALGDEALTLRELTALAKQKSSLVRLRGQWVSLDLRELADIRKRLAAGPTQLPARAALQAALTGELRQDGLVVQVQATGALLSTIEELRSGGATPQPAPATLRAELRPYQARGLHWLSTMGRLGLGACLADDMGLGKTMQLLAFLLRRLEEAPTDCRPTLLIAPTSVIGNWERELQRFAPSLNVVHHYGADRAQTPEAMPNKPGTVVLTTYGLLRRDLELLSQVEWSVAALDEAQNIKNAASSTARAARALRASHRFVLTGTPVENRLAELWSLLEFANPGLLGSLESFRRDFAQPIERYGDDEAARRLRAVTGPFILRRLKSDPSIIQDLPAKNEMDVVCTLSREQATLYQAVVEEELRRIETSSGMERRGRVLALLMFTKQICNHPAQYLSEAGPLPKRSGKLTRVTEMLEEALAAGDKSLVFTQFRDMGDKLVAHFSEALGTEAMFLHGGTSKKARDEMVRRFQEERHGPQVFILSVKAGGTGLNLTAANHVFHYDRWWNPAVEDQATDRAYRIGQTRAVQVHKCLCAGTVEEKIARLLEQKRALAAKVVGTGEQWLTELGTSELRELFSLSDTQLGATTFEDEESPVSGAPPPRRKASPRTRREEARS